MQVTNLKLINFRNYDLLNISFSKKKNIFYGENGSGKTNILEAIYVLSLTKSFRTINDKVLLSRKTSLSYTLKSTSLTTIDKITFVTKNFEYNIEIISSKI